MFYNVKTNFYLLKSKSIIPDFIKCYKDMMVWKVSWYPASSKSIQEVLIRVKLPRTTKDKYDNTSTRR